jgi:hypothetical protein
MLVSGNFLKNSLENYNKSQSKNKEFYSKKEGGPIESGFNVAFYTFILVIAMIFFIMELFLLYFAISIAIYCSTSKEERIVNFVMATIFTLPYVLLKTIFDPCSKNYLKNGLNVKF